MMLRGLVILVVLVAALEARALTPPQGENSADEPAEPPPARDDRPEPAPRDTAAPAPTFSPTEKIEADSAVSFPVDI